MSKMVGNQIYLLYRQNLKEGGILLLAPHATYDGVMEQLEAERLYWETNGWPVERYVDSSFLLKDNFTKEPKYYYFISQRTIEK